MSELVNNVFNINNCKTCYLGATLLSCSPSIGHDFSVMANSKNNFFQNAKSALSFYPEVEMIELEKIEEEDPYILSLSSLWVNGFASYSKGLIDAENMTKKCQQYLAGIGIPTTDQILKSRPDEMMQTLFAHMAWFGSNGDDGRIIDKHFIDQSSKTRLVNKGMISTEWESQPVNVKYLIKNKAEDDSELDYLYLVGGDAILFTPDELLSYIKNNWEESFKNKVTSNNVWAVSKNNENYIRMERIIQSVFLIRNYFIYAHKYIKIDDATEVNWEKEKPVFKNIKIIDIIKKYQIVYEYCKNLVTMYNDF